MDLGSSSVVISESLIAGLRLNKKTLYQPEVEHLSNRLRVLHLNETQAQKGT